MVVRMLVGLLMVAVVGGGIVIPPVYADGDAVDQALGALEKAVKEDQTLSPALRQALENLSQVMQEERRERAPAVREDVREEVSAVLKDRLKGLRVSGDFRLRQETDFDRRGSELFARAKSNRNRQRIRGRLGLTFDVNDEWTAGTRLRTGNPDDPNSPHQTLDGVFDSLEANFDQWYGTYRPAWGGGLWLTGGKFAHPFKMNPVYGELVWDADVNPEGGIVGYNRKNITETLKEFQLVAGVYSLLEQDLADEASMIVTQGAGTVSLAKDLSASLAVGFYRYTNLTPDGSVAVLRDNEGNAIVDRNGDGKPDDFLSNFSIINPMLHLTYTDLILPYTGRRMPLVVGGEFMHNFDAFNDEDEDGWAIGAALGSSEKKGDLRLAYQWQVLQQESIFSPFAQDDFLLATNSRSHIVSLHYRLTDKIELRPWLLISRFDKGNDRDQYRLRFDLNMSF